MQTESLTKEQAEALTLKDGVVIAGAGAGKTRTMVAKILHDQKVRDYASDDQIVVTFTNSAALEMSARLEAAGARKPRHIGTLHSLAMRAVMKAWGGKLDVLTDAGYDAAIRSVLKRCRVNVPVSTARDWIMNPPKMGNGLAVRKAILSELKAQRLIHPDVMLIVFLELTRTNPERADVRVYVDEAQDASPIDAAIYQNLATSGQNRGSIILFGDPRQSIYGFRGSDPAIFQRAVSLYGDGIVNLTANFRSSRAVVIEANRIAALMDLQHVEPMEPMTDIQGSIDRERFTTTEAEALALAKTIRGQSNAGETVAVLCRYNAVADMVASLLRGEGFDVERPGIEIPKHAALEALRNLDPSMIPTGGWEPTLMRLGVPFCYQDHLAKMLSGVRDVLAIGPVIDEALGRPTDRSKVWVSTVHAAKGLEWDHVHLVGADSLSFDPNDQEDVRLAYVAATRPRTTFSVSFGASRVAEFGRVDSLQPSPLLFP